MRPPGVIAPAGKARKAASAAAALSRLRSPLLELSLIRLEEGTATSRDMRRLERLKGNERIARAILALSPRVRDCDYRTNACLAGDKGLQAALASRFSHKEERRANAAGIAFYFSSMSIVGAIIISNNLSLIASFVMGGLLGLLWFVRSTRLRRSRHELADMLISSRISEEAKAALAPHASIEALRLAHPASGDSAFAKARERILERGFQMETWH